MNFARLIHPCTVEEFFQHYYEKVYLLNTRAVPDYFDEVLNEADLDLFFAQQDLNPATIKLVKDGVPIPIDLWTKTIERSAGPLKTFICQEEVFEHYYKGATIVINAAEKMIPGITKACSAMERETRLLFQANIYITPPNSQGFSMHYDDHDIFSLQVKGTKRWKMYDAGEELPTNKRPFRKNPELISKIELHPGDLLYMPRGLVHEAFSTTTSTIHVNFSCKGVYGFDLLKTLSEVAEEEDVFFRKMIPHGFSSVEEIAGYKAVFMEKLLSLIDKYDVEALLQKRQLSFLKTAIVDFKGRFSDAMALEKLNVNSVIAKRKAVDYHLEKTTAGMIVSFGEHQISVSKIFDLSLFFKHEPFKVADIKGIITDHGKLVLVREFVEAGFLQIVEN
jgi:hypothetical protein